MCDRYTWCNANHNPGAAQNHHRLWAAPGQSRNTRLSVRGNPYQDAVWLTFSGQNPVNQAQRASVGATVAAVDLFGLATCLSDLALYATDLGDLHRLERDAVLLENVP